MQESSNCIFGRAVDESNVEQIIENLKSEEAKPSENTEKKE